MKPSKQSNIKWVLSTSQIFGSAAGSNRRNTNDNTTVSYSTMRDRCLNTPGVAVRKVKQMTIWWHERYLFFDLEEKYNDIVKKS